MIRLPPKVIAATVLVAVFPVLAVWALDAAGIIDSVLASTTLGAALSIGFYRLAEACWERQRDSGDVLFADLMLWGWIARRRQEQRLANAVTLLGERDLDLRGRSEVLERLASDLETRDPYTHGHSRRVARYSALIAARMGLPEAEVVRIRTAAAVHDVGKLGIPVAILHKPGRLTEDEFVQVKQHPVDGAELVSLLEDDELTAIVRHHHERLDGGGYPDRLRDSQIPLGARIIAVADTFDAITSARSYRDAKPHKAALDILAAEAGTQLDGDAVAAFRSAYRARRPVGAWIALTDGAERLLAWLAGGAIGSTARLAAVAAGTVAAGGGALTLQAAFAGTEGSPPPHPVQAAVAHLVSAPHALSVSGASVGPAPARTAPALKSSGSGRGSSRPNTSGVASPSHSGSSGVGPVSGASGGSGGSTGSGGSSGGGTSGGGGSGGGGSGGGTVGAGVGGHGVGVTVGTGSGSGSPGVSVGVGTGNGGPAVTGTTGGSSQGTGVGVSTGNGGPSIGVSTGTGSGLHPKVTVGH